MGPPCLSRKPHGAAPLSRKPHGRPLCRGSLMAAPLVEEASWQPPLSRKPHGAAPLSRCSPGKLEEAKTIGYKGKLCVGKKHNVETNKF